MNKTEQTCERCRANASGGRQIYTVTGELGKYIFDVSLARSIVRNGNRAPRRQVSQVPYDLLEKMLWVNEDHDKVHLDHVNPAIPGILGQRFGGVALIDGTHRAYRCLRDKLPFYAYMLDLVESHRCLIGAAPVDFTPELMARELKGMLRNNPMVEMMTTVLDLTGEEDATHAEAAIRSHLSAEENARLTIQLPTKSETR